MTSRKIEMPESIHVAPHNVEVRTQDDLIPSANVMGHYSGEVNRITVDGTLQGTALTDTVLHELIHAMWSQTPLDRQYTDAQEEEIVWALTPRLLALLRDNPDMVRWLCE